MSPSSQPSGLNAGYVAQLLEQYLENPEAVDPAWRELFESGGDAVLATLPGLSRLVGDREPRPTGTARPRRSVEPPASHRLRAPEPEPAPAPEPEPAAVVARGRAQVTSCN